MDQQWHVGYLVTIWWRHKYDIYVPLWTKPDPFRPSRSYVHAKWGIGIGRALAQKLKLTWGESKIPTKLTRQLKTKLKKQTNINHLVHFKMIFFPSSSNLVYIHNVKHLTQKWEEQKSTGQWQEQQQWRQRKKGNGSIKMI